MMMMIYLESKESIFCSKKRRKDTLPSLIISLGYNIFRSPTTTKYPSMRFDSFYLHSIRK